MLATRSQLVLTVSGIAAALAVLGGSIILVNLKPGDTTDANEPAPLAASDVNIVSPEPATPPTPDPEPEPYLAASTRQMAALLRRTAEQTDPARNRYDNTRRITMIEQQLRETEDDRARIDLMSSLTTELLYAGRTNDAIEQLDQLRRLGRRRPATMRGDYLTLIEELTAVAYLRLGEQENCIDRHSFDSCLLPIRGAGVHTKTRGSREAIDRFAQLLQNNPTDLRSRWLLNVAYSTLGEHPHKVPPQWLIRFDTLESGYDIKRFHDVAAGLDMAVLGLSGGSVMEDFDGDNLLDIMASSWGFDDQLRYFHNNGDGTFSDHTAQAGLTGLVGGLNLIHADYNNDGHADVYVLRGAWLVTEGKQPNSLLQNNGDGTFDDVTERAGLVTLHPTQTAAWGDFDNDGWIDLFVGNESSQPKGLVGGWANASVARDVDPATLEHPCELFRNNGDGTFTNVAAQVGVEAIGYTKGVAWGDYNNDGRVDLHVSRFGQPNLLYRNDGAAPSDSSSYGWSFTEVADSAGVSEPTWSFPTWFFDYDNDGWLDIFVAGYRTHGVVGVAADYIAMRTPAERPRLYHNNGDGTFTDVADRIGLTTATLPMGANFGDIDNDGWLDIYLGTGDPSFRTLIPNRMLRNVSGQRFQDVTISGGFGHLQKGHGIAFGDIDNDGDQDIYTVIGGAFASDVGFNALFLNPGHDNRWLTLQLVGNETNRAAIGARIKVTIGTPDGSRDIYATVGSGGSFGASSLQQEIGLGDARAILAVEISWPTTGVVQRFTDIPLDAVVRIEEGAAQWSPIDAPPIDLTKHIGAMMDHEQHGH